MIRTWKTPTMMFLLSAATIAVTPPTLFAQVDKQPAEVEGIDKLQKAIKALDKKLDQFKQSAADKDAVADAVRLELQRLQDGALKELKNELAAIRAGQKKAREDQEAGFILLALRIEALQGRNAPAVDKAFMDDMKRSMKNMEDTLAKFGPTEKRTSFSPPIDGIVAPRTGRVRFTNNFSTELLFAINGREYRVLPGVSVTVVDVPAGVVNYAITDSFGPLGRQATTLNAGQTFDVTAR